MANGRTGLVFLEDYDVGLASTIGGELIDILLDGETADVYALRAAGITGPDQYKGLVPIIMEAPEDAYTANLLPQIVISRGSITPDMARWFPGGREYMVPAHRAETVEGTYTGIGEKTRDEQTIRTGVKGPSKVEIKAWALPFEISYDVHVRARLRSQADKLFRIVGAVLWKWGQIRLRDSEGDERGYYAFLESIDQLSDIGDIADRMMGHTFSLRVEAELDFHEPFLARTTPHMVINTLPKPVSGPLRARRR